VKYKYGETFQFKPISDVHIGNKAFDKKAFKEYLADSGERTRFVGIGDLYDAIVSTDPRYSKATDIAESSAILDEAVAEGVELLEPYKDRSWGWQSLSSGIEEMQYKSHKKNVRQIGSTLSWLFGSFTLDILTVEQRRKQDGYSKIPPRLGRGKSNNRCRPNEILKGCFLLGGRYFPLWSCP